MKPVRIFSALLLLTLLLMVSVLAAGTETGIRESYDIRLTARTSTEVTVSLTNHTGSGEPVVFILAAYDRSGQLMDCKTAKTAAFETSLTAACTADSPVKAFVLNAETYAPMRDVWENDPSAPDSPKALVVYFSYSGTTEKIAGYVAEAAEADTYRIIPEVPYTDDILKYYDESTRAYQEQNDPDARPAISGTVEKINEYDVIFIGYPIWYGQAPKILYSFLESYDFSGKMLIPFCTSGSSGIGSSGTNLARLTGGATWLAGQRFAGSAAKTDVEAWVSGLFLDER